MRAVLDTNVVMSAIFFGGTPLKIIRAAVSKNVQLVASRAVVSEYREVAERLRGEKTSRIAPTSARKYGIMRT